MVPQGVKGLSMGFGMSFTGTAEHVINVLFDVVLQVLACEACCCQLLKGDEVLESICGHTLLVGSII